jgi:hypothetical protein
LGACRGGGNHHRKTAGQAQYRTHRVPAAVWFGAVFKSVSHALPMSAGVPIAQNMPIQSTITKIRAFAGKSLGFRKICGLADVLAGDVFR